MTAVARRGLPSRLAIGSAYLLGLAAALALLFGHGLAVLGIALLAVEATMVTTTLTLSRRPGTSARRLEPTARRSWQWVAVLGAMLAICAALVGLAVLAAHFG